MGGTPRPSTPDCVSKHPSSCTYATTATAAAGLHVPSYGDDPPSYPQQESLWGLFCCLWIAYDVYSATWCHLLGWQKTNGLPRSAAAYDRLGWTWCPCFCSQKHEPVLGQKVAL